jgi:NAD(P)H-nitrite reductase large subunit
MFFKRFQVSKTAAKAGNTTIEAVQEATGASTHCGGCKEKVEELIEQFK